MDNPRILVAVTDKNWYETLHQLPQLEDVNFWSPSATGFKALRQGELFLFKLHEPDSKIVGGGVFYLNISLPISTAWEFFQQGNGVRSKQKLLESINKYSQSVARDSTQIGCRILTNSFFLDRAAWIDVPTSWSKNIVSCKGFSTAENEGRLLWDAVITRFPNLLGTKQSARPCNMPTLISSRPGQAAFRVKMLDSYTSRCAITRERTVVVLDAAHIQPYSEGGAHAVTNGLLLRRDIHRLFDVGYVTVTPELSFEVSNQLKKDYSNGEVYYALRGTAVATPKETVNAPATMQAFQQALAWHNENRFIS